VEKVQEHLDAGPTHVVGGSLNWVATYDLAYLPHQLWDDGGSFEGALWAGTSTQVGKWSVGWRATATGGVMYRNPSGGFSTTNRYDAQAYFRPELVATATHTLGKDGRIGIRGYAAGVFSSDPVLSQRRIFLSGADPYQTISNPFVRSIGAPLNRDDCWCRWHTPGGGDLRGYNAAFSTDRLVALNVEVESALLHPRSPLASRVAVAFFADGGHTSSARGIGGEGDSTSLPVPHQWLADAGFGLRITQRIGTTTWTTRIDLPVFVSEPQWSFAHRLTSIGFNRLLVSFSPVIR